MDPVTVPPGTIAATPIGADDAVVRRGWIASPPFDAALILGAPIVGLMTMLVATSFAGAALLLTALAYFVGIPHYLSTFVFFAGDDQREHYLARPLAFLAGPLLIFAAVAALRLSGAFEIVLATIFVWNIWHVAMQSAGVASLYRQLHGGPQSEKRVAHLAILTTNAAMALWFAHTFPPLVRYLTAPLIEGAAIACAVAAAFSAGLLLARVARRPRRISVAEGAALLSGLTLFHPFLWVDNLETATFGMLIGHFVQYLALVWLIQARKFAPRHDGSVAQRCLAAVSRRPWAILATFAVVGAVAVVVGRGFSAAGQQALFIILLNALALVHFYLDGLIWAFRNPAVRRALGPWVTLPSHRAAA